MTVFYFLAGFSFLGALGVVFGRNPVYCALSLVACLVGVAGVFILLGHEFIAAVQILVYAGAIVVLFLFVIMLLNLKEDALFGLRWPLKTWLAGLICGALFLQLTVMLLGLEQHLGEQGEYAPERLVNEGSVRLIGDALLTDYLLHFEAISIILLVAVMAAVVIAKRRIRLNHDEPARERTKSWKNKKA